MKKFTLSAACISLILIAALSTSSCARKVGCYFSDAQKMERTRDNDSQCSVTFSKITNQEIKNFAVDITCD
jgi:hypothetical protein